MRHLLGSLLALVATATVAQDAKMPAPRGCEWQWNGSQWTLVVFNCFVENCSPPAMNGSFVGQTVFTACSAAACR